MTRTEMKKAVQKLVDVALGNPSIHNMGLMNEIVTARNQLLAQIDVMYQGADENETFADLCSYCGGIMTDGNAHFHKDGVCEMGGEG